MEIKVFDLQLNNIGVVDEIISFIWTRRYYTFGEFSILLPFTENNIELLKVRNLVCKSGEQGQRELGQITYINVKKDGTGITTIEVLGVFLTSWLSNIICLTNPTATNKVGQIFSNIVNNNLVNIDTKRKIPLLGFSIDINIDNTQIGFIADDCISVYSAFETLSNLSNIGYQIKSDLRAKIHTLTIFKGKDLTSGQQINPQCIFSIKNDNVSEQDYTNSIDNYKNIALVRGADKNIVEVGSSTPNERREVFIDVTDTSDRNTLIQHGLAELENYKEVLNFNNKINALGNLKYKTDYDLGDIVTCIDKSWGIKVDVRITEITETYQMGVYSIDIVFGNSMPIIIGKFITNKKR